MIEGLPACARPARLTRARRLLIYSVGAGLWLSGALWLVFHYFVHSAGAFGATRHPLEPWWLALHGGFAFASLWLLGLLWGVHIMAGWTSAQRRWSGGSVLATLGVLVVSGYLLYYAGDDTLRAGTSILHWTLGLALPTVFIVHRGVRRSRPAADGEPLASATVTPLARPNEVPLRRRGV